MRDFVEKIVKAKLGMYFPLIMYGAALLYEVGDDLDEAMVANYAANLEKVCFLSLCLVFLAIVFSMQVFPLQISGVV